MSVFDIFLNQLVSDNEAMNKIADIRKSKGWSMEQLAIACEPTTTASQISKLEKGRTKLSENWMRRISNALGCSASELLGESPSSHVDWADLYTFVLGLAHGVARMRSEDPDSQQQSDLQLAHAALGAFDVGIKMRGINVDGLTLTDISDDDIKSGEDELKRVVIFKA